MSGEDATLDHEVYAAIARGIGRSHGLMSHLGWSDDNNEDCVALNASIKRLRDSGRIDFNTLTGYWSAVRVSR